MKSIVLKSALAAVCLFCCTLNSIAQSASSYGFTASSGTYAYLSGGTALDIIEDDDALSGAIPIGFTFNFCGTDYTQIKASSNGWITFNSTVTGSVPNNTVANMGTIKPGLFPLWDDMAGYEDYGSVASYSTTGTAGAREFTIEYKNWQWDYGAEEGVITFRVTLYEGSNRIRFHYKRESGAVVDGSSGASIGICDGAGTPTYLALNNVSATPTPSSATFTRTLSNKPANGQIYQFNPPLPTCTTPAPGATVATPSAITCLGGSTTLSVTTAPTGTGNSFQWQSSPDGTTYANIAGATASTYKATPFVPTYYKCIVTCANGPVSTTSTAVYVNFANPVPFTVPGSRCGTGVVNLGAAATFGTLRWYAASSGGTALGSGTSFTTPSIGTSTTYYVGSESSSAGTVVVGAGASTTVSSGLSADVISPFDHYYGGFKSQYLFTAAELRAAGLSAGNITAISLDVVSGGIKYEGFKLAIGTTAAAALTSTPAGSLTNVYTTTAPAGLTTPASGACTITFSAPYNWDGTSNLVLEACWSNNNTGGTGTTVRYDATSFVSHNFYQDDSQTPAVICGATSMTTLSARPKVTFSGNMLCSTPRAAVLATVNTAPAFAITTTQTVCNNSAAQVSVTSTLSSYNSYTWTPVTNLFTDAGCTVAYTAGTSASTVYSKSAVANAITYTAAANNSVTLCAASDTSRVTTLPASATSLATPESICVSGTTTLTLNPASGYGNAIFQWQQSTDNTSFTDIGSAAAATYTTPVLSATKYFRALIKNSAGTTCITSGSDTALVNNPRILTTVPATRCGPGVLNLSATGAEGTLKWYAAATGGSSIATGTGYTTPTLLNTTTYYVEAEAKAPILANSGTAGTTLGTATDDNGLTPFSGYYEGQHTQYLVLAADLVAGGLSAGAIEGLSFNISTKNSTLAYSGYTVKIAQVAATSLSALLTPTFTTVYGPASYTAVSGTNNFDFASGFNWNGSSNILVDVCFSNDPSATGDIYSSNDVVSATTKSYTATYGWYEDNSALCGTSSGDVASSSKLPVITFRRSGCKSSRTAVVATINPLPKPLVTPAGPLIICDRYPAKLTATGGDTYQWRNESGNIAGATANTYTVTTTGKYKVVATTTASGCFDSSLAVNITVNPSPTVSITPVGTTTICADSLQMLRSTHTGTGITYQWYKDEVALSGATKDSFSATAAGTYTLRVSLTGCVDTSNKALLNVNPLPAASFEITSLNKAICKEGTIELTANATAAGSAYQWLINGVPEPAAGSRIYTATKEGIYTVQVRDANNCRRTSDTMTIFHTPLLKMEVHPKDVRFCDGNVIKLYNNAAPYGVSYAWARNDTLLAGETKEVTLAGTSGSYAVTVKDIFNCVTTSPGAVITVYPLPAKPPVYKDGMILSTDVYSSYQWYRNGKPITGATSRRYTMSFDGHYHVVVGNALKCYAESDALHVEKLGVAQYAQDLVIEVYPNPSRDIVYIESPVPVRIQLRDIQGKQLLEQEKVNQVDLAAFADGMYLLQIADMEGHLLRTERLVKSSR